MVGLKSTIIWWKNDVRPAAVSRRRWLFVGHPDAGWRGADI
jgi:hypothetical protein